MKNQPKYFGDFRHVKPDERYPKEPHHWHYVDGVAVQIGPAASNVVNINRSVNQKPV